MNLTASSIDSRFATHGHFGLSAVVDVLLDSSRSDKK